MKQELEIEFKNLLTEEEYEKLFSHFFNKQDEGFSQRNVYFDTDTLALKKSKCALRIRTKDKQAELTLKTPFEGHHHETNINLDLNEAEKKIKRGRFNLPPELFEFLKEKIDLNEQNVNKLAELNTFRHEKEYQGCLIVLDKSTYNDTVDFELEVEAPSIERGKEVFNSLLEDFAIPDRETPNKIARAFKGRSNV